MDLDSIIQNLSQLGAELNAADVSANNSPLKSSAGSRSGCQLKKKPRHNVSFSDKPPVFYESEPPSDADRAEPIYEGLGTNIFCSAPLTLALLLESRKSQSVTTETEMKVSCLDTELESVLRELHVLSEECESSDRVDVGRSPDDGDDLDDDDDSPPPIPPPPVMSALSEEEDDDDDDDDTLRNKTSSREILSDSAAQTLTSQATDVRPLSYDSNFSSDSTSTNTNDSASNKSSDSHSDKLHSSVKHSLRYQPHSTSFSDSLPQVTAHPKNSNQMCVKVHSEDGSAKTIAVSRETTVHQLCCILVKKYRHPISKAWSIVEQWNDISSERLLEGHLRVVDEVKKWPQNSDNQLWFADINKKYDLFNDPQISESLLTNSFVPNCEGQLYLKSLCKNSWKKFNFVLRSSGLYYATKGKASKSSDLTCLSSLLDVDIFTGMHTWNKEFKAPTRFGIALKPIGSSKLNIQNPLKCLCAEDGKTLQKWVDALRLAKYGKKLYEDFITPMVLPPPAIPPLPQHVAASWSNLIEDELDRVANNHRLQKSSVSLRDCSQLNASLDSTFRGERRSDSVHSDDKAAYSVQARLSNSVYHGRNSTEQIPPPLDSYSPLDGCLDLNSTCYYQRIVPNVPQPMHVGHSPGERTSNYQVNGYSINGQLRSSTSFDKNLPSRSRDDDYVGVGASPFAQFSPAEPVYDYINEVPRARHESFHGNRFQTSPFRREYSVQTLNSPRAILMNSSLPLEDRTRPAYACHSGRTPLLAMNPLPQRSLMNGSRSNSEIASIVENAYGENFEFPPPPTPEIFQFLEQNKNDILPQKQNLYEVPSIGSRTHPHRPPLTGVEGFYRQGSLNRSFTKGLVQFENDYRALNNSYTMEPTEFSFLRGMHHSFHSADRGSTTSPKRKPVQPPPPPRRLETTGLSGKPPPCNTPHSVHFCRPSPNSEGIVVDRTSKTQNVIDLLNKMIVQKLELGASGPANWRGSFCDNELDDLPPAPKELLDNLKLMKVNEKQRFVFCNS